MGLENREEWSWASTIHTPENQRLQPKNGGLEDDFHFQLGDLQVPCQFSGGYNICVYLLNKMLKRA